MNNIYTNRIYADSASITPIDPKIRKNLYKYQKKMYANPSSIHKEGVISKDALLDARKNISKIINCKSNEIVFTSSGTEANNIAILGLRHYILKNSSENLVKNHIIISSIEHSSVIESVKELVKNGFEITWLKPDKNGKLDLNDVIKSIKKETLLVSVMLANNETGVIHDIGAISRQIRKFERENETRIFFHTDACQAFPYLKIDVHSLGVDLLTLDSNKIYGPRGVGIIYIKTGVDVKNIIFGGSQEFSIRPGTENVPSILAFSDAVGSIANDREKNVSNLIRIKSLFEAELKKLFQEVIIVGENSDRLPHISNVIFPNIDGEYFAFLLDANGISVSTKSACLKDESNSYVLSEMGYSNEESKGAIRFSFLKNVKKGEIIKLLKTVKKCYNTLHGAFK